LEGAVAAFVVSYDGSGTQRFLVGARKLASPAVQRAMVETLGQAGDKTRTAVRRALWRQTAAKKYGTIVAATRSYILPAVLEYRIEAKGKGLPIEEFKGLRVTRRGNAAAPWNSARTFKRSFANGGYRARLGSARFPVRRLFGPSMPKEIIKDQSAETFERTGAAEVARILPRRVGRLMP
jgi:hypothetical protein